MKKRTNNAFTLVELLIVIGIIAVLISILLPALNKARRSAISLACLSNLRQYELYNQIYANENHGYCIPTLVQTPIYPSTLNWSQNTLYPNIRKFLNFPTSPGFYLQGSANYNQICGEALYALNVPTGDHFYNVGYSYGMNYSDFNDPGNAYGPTNRLLFFGNAGTPGAPYVPAISYNMARIRNPSQKIAWADSIGWWINFSTSNVYVGEGVSISGIAYRHDGGTNIAIRILIGVCLFTTAANADVKPAALFADHMIVQRDATVPVWGTDTTGQSVTVKFGGQEKTAIAGADGKWLVKLDAIPASGDGRAMTIAGSSTVTVNDVLVGEVWLLSGQSNMLFGMAATTDAATELPKATDPSIRYLAVEGGPADSPVADLATKGWQVNSPQNAKTFSAVGYHFARRIHEALGVPIGLICNAENGVRIQTWIPQATLESLPEGKADVDKYLTQSKSWTPESNSKTYEAMVAKFDADTKVFQQLPADQQKPELKPMKPHEPMEPAKNAQHPFGLYNGRLAPMMPYAIRGAVWYQGEANGFGSGGYLYRDYLSAMITSWRAAWGEGDFPFILVQLPNFDWGNMTAEWAILRESQSIATTRTANTAMVVSADVGEPKNLHPRNKKTVGERAALAALHLTYGKDVVFSGPTFTSAKFQDGKVILAFGNLGSGLMTKGDNLTGFEMARTDQKFSTAEASIDGDQVIVTGDVASPVAVRYGWAPAPLLSLYNKEGLPASPFRTDDWPVQGQPGTVKIAVAPATKPTKPTTAPGNTATPSASLPIPKAPPAPPGPPVGHTWEPLALFTDDFDGEKLDATKWDDHDPKWIGRPPGLFMPGNVALKDGVLHLAAKLEDVPAPANPDPKQYHKFTTSFVKSKTMATYGYYEIRAKPMNSNIDSAFWFYGIEPDWHTEIDVFEIPGGNAKEGFTDRMTIHIFKTPDFKVKNGEFYKSGEQWHAPFRFADEFHVYGLEWDEQLIKWSVDGVVRRIMKNEYNHRPMNLCLDNEVFPGWFGIPTDESLPATFDVDYVHAWRRTDTSPTTQP